MHFDNVVTDRIPIRIPGLKINGKFVLIASEILSEKKNNRKTDTTLLERQIDELVYKLYDLTYEEVKVVDPGFWLSREDYGKVRLGLPEESKQQ